MDTNAMIGGLLLPLLTAFGMVDPPPPQAGPQSRPSAAPNRIVALAPSTAEIIFDLGEGRRLVGISRYATFPPEVTRLPKVGGLRDPDLEAIVSLKPDLVILRGQNTPVEQLCADSGIRLFHDRTETLPDLFATIDALGRELAVPDTAKRLADSLQARLDAVRLAARQRPRPRVLVTMRTPDRLGSLTTVARGSFLNDLIDLAGGDNVFADVDAPYPEVALEEILLRKPDVIVEIMPGQTLDDAQRREIAGQWRAAGLGPVVDSGRLHLVTEDFALIPSPRVVLMAEKLASLFSQGTDSRAPHP